MEAFVFALLDDKVNEVFIEAQKEFGITSGDIEPLDAYELNDKEHELTMLIGKLLRKQRGEPV